MILGKKSITSGLYVKLYRVSQKNETPCLLNISVTKYLIFKLFFPLKTETHTKISNTKPFLCDIKGLRNLQNEK